MSFELSLINNSQLMAQAQTASVLECNYISAAYGLALTADEAKELLSTRSYSLRATGRIEFSGAVIQKLIAAFCSSSYLDKSNYASALCELTEVFYAYKSEFLELLSDDELINLMYEAFEKYSGGSVQILSDDLMSTMARNLRFGYDPFYEEPDRLDEDELYEEEKRRERDV